MGLRFGADSGSQVHQCGLDTVEAAVDGLLEVVQLLLEPEKQLVLFQGALLADDTTLGGAGCVNSERLYLEFRAPWEPEEGEAQGAAKPPPKKKK